MTPAARALASDLSIVDLEGPPVTRWLGARLEEVVRGQASLTYTIAIEDDAPGVLDLALTKSDDESLEQDLLRYTRALAPRWTVYDPRSVDPRDADRFLTLGTPRRFFGGRAPRRYAASLDRMAQGLMPLYARWGTADWDTLRAVLCDDGRMVAYVAVLRADRFGPAERGAAQALVAPIRRRFAIEERLSVRHGSSMASALLEEIPAAAYVLSGSRVVATNHLGRARLDRDAGHREHLERAARGTPDADLTRVDLALRGAPGHVLLLARTPASASAGTPVAAARYGLTPRETQVLACLAGGRTNRAIAAALGCGERTVETHVSRLLAKTDCASRSEIVALVAALGAR